MSNKGVVLAGLILTGGLLLLAVSQNWFTAIVSNSSHDITGSSVTSIIATLGFVTLALGGAIIIAQKVVRFILGIMAILVGVAAVVTTILILRDPVSATVHALSEVTGLAGSVGQSEITTTFWPYLVIIAGVLITVTGLNIVFNGRAWPQTSNRIDPNGTDWDQLSRGQDPTQNLNSTSSSS